MKCAQLNLQELWNHIFVVRAGDHLRKHKREEGYSLVSSDNVKVYWPSCHSSVGVQVHKKSHSSSQ